MSSKMRKPISILLLMALVVSGLAACGTPTAAPEPTKAEVPTTEPETTKAEVATTAPEPTEVEVPTTEPEPAIQPGELEVGVGWTEGTAFDLVKEIGDSMEQDYPGTKVTYTFNNTEARPAITMRMEAGDPLDVDWAFTALRESSHSLVDNDYIYDLTDTLNEARADGTRWIDDFHPVFVPALTYKDRIWGAPDEVWVMLLHYNKGLFDQWGLQPPKTWAELLTLCETIKAKGVAPIAVTGQVPDYVGIWSDLLFQRIAGTDKTMEVMWKETDKGMATDADYLLAAQELNKLATSGYLIDGWQALDFTTSQLYFFQGKAAMILMGSWLMKEMKDSIPEGFQLGVAPFPTYDGGHGNQEAMFGNVTGWNVMAQSDVPDLAIEFLRRYTSDEAATKRVEQLGSFVPNSHVAQPTGVYGATEAMAAASGNEFILYFFGVSGGQFGMSTAWYGPIVEMWAGQLTPEEALTKIDANLNSIREQRKLAGGSIYEPTATP
ncbi:MAG TPA: extracellular solute-binding protein [Anaerolineae bacterium]|nr:extracellular solute-binding protein [Anaerolineae bacterium]